jgi:uncharacterized membrane protein
MSMPLRLAYLASGASLIALMLLAVAWELWLAPLRPGGSWLVLKVLPLALCLFGVLRGRRRTYQALSLLVWLYFAEGVVRSTSDPGAASARLAVVEIVLCVVLFIAVSAYARLARGHAPAAS